MSIHDAKIREEALRLKNITEARDGFQRFIYKGRCMAPLLQDEDLLLVKASDFKGLRTGDLILFKAEGALWVHRYLFSETWKDGTPRLYAKADNSWTLDAPFPPENLIGILHETRRGSRILRFFSWKLKILSRIAGGLSVLEARLFSFYKKLQKKIAGRTRLPPFVKRLGGAIAGIPKKIVILLSC